MAAGPAPALIVCNRWDDDGAATVTVRGQIDAVSADAFYERLAGVAGDSPRRLVIERVFPAAAPGKGGLGPY